MIEVDISHIWGGVSLPDLLEIEKDVAAAHEMLMEGNGEGSEFRGWLELPTRKPRSETTRILETAQKIRTQSDVCVVVGIGGSYLGCRAAIELLQGPNRNYGRGKGDPQIFFAGNTLSTRHWNELVHLLEGRDFTVIVISKSGTTLESALAFRSLRWVLERKYGTEEAGRRIYAITDPENGALRQMANEQKWESFAIPSDVGGRFSVLSPVGLLPMAVAGIDILEMLKGAMDAKENYNFRSFENPLWLYTGVRNTLYRSGKAAELFVSYEPGFRMFGQWWQQLFGESEGKNGKGILPVSVEFPADLHSLGQLIQQGERNIFETVIHFDPPELPFAIGSDVNNLDGLNYLAGKTLDEVEEMTRQGTLDAHVDGGVPVITMDCGKLDARTVGELFFFLELACSISAYTLGVNPFDQPGVECYKENTQRLLGKPDLQKTIVQNGK